MVFFFFLLPPSQDSIYADRIEYGVESRDIKIALVFILYDRI